MLSALQGVQQIAAKTDEILLFHSGPGKDSLALAHMASPYFKRIVCVHMYIVPGLQHIENYIDWTKRRYPNIEFIQLPHYSLGSYIKTGFMGITQDKKQKLYRLKDITEMARAQTGIQWAMFGFKQSDSLNRRLMLRGYDHQMINWSSQKVYPLSQWKNGDVLKYLKNANLPKPISYGSTHQSSGTAISDINFLLWCRENSPEDLAKVYKMFPDAETLVFRHDNGQL